MARVKKIKTNKPTLNTRYNHVHSETEQNHPAILSKSSGLLMYGGLILLAIMGVIAVLWTTAPYGLGATSDSAHYISCARSLIEGQGFKVFDGSP